MSDPRLPFRVARLVVAAAWADGTIHALERAYLRRRFGDMPNVSGADWASLSELLDHPMSADDRQAALADVIDVVETNADKAFVLDTVVEIVTVDNVITDAEIELLEQVKGALEGKPTGVMQRVSRLVGGLLRSGRPAGGTDA